MTYGLMTDFDRAFNGLWGSRFAPNDRRIVPSCEVSEADEAYHLSFDVPGMRKEDISIELKDHRLTVSGERKRSSHENRRTGEVQEKTYGFFERSFNLPETAYGEKIEAHFENGVLEIVVPKKEETKPRRIEIKSNDSKE